MKDLGAVTITTKRKKDAKVSGSIWIENVDQKEWINCIHFVTWKKNRTRTRETVHLRNILCLQNLCFFFLGWLCVILRAQTFDGGWKEKKKWNKTFHVIGRKIRFTLHLPLISCVEIESKYVKVNWNLNTFKSIWFFWIVSKDFTFFFLLCTLRGTFMGKLKQKKGKNP